MTRTPRYRPPRRHGRGIGTQIALTAAVVVFAVALVITIMVSRDDDTPIDAQPIRTPTASAAEQRPVVAVYTDYLCPHCAKFDRDFGPTLDELVDTGAITVDYYPVAILDSPRTQNFSSRAAAAAYCVADNSFDAFRRYHTALYGMSAGVLPSDAELTDLAHRSGATDPAVADCISTDRHGHRVRNLAQATGIRSTPTVRINDQEYPYTTPEALRATVVGG